MLFSIAQSLCPLCSMLFSEAHGKTNFMFDYTLSVSFTDENFIIILVLSAHDTKLWFALASTQDTRMKNSKDVNEVISMT